MKNSLKQLKVMLTVTASIITSFHKIEATQETIDSWINEVINADLTDYTKTATHCHIDGKNGYMQLARYHFESLIAMRSGKYNELVYPRIFSCTEDLKRLESKQFVPMTSVEELKSLVISRRA